MTIVIRISLFLFLQESLNSSHESKTPPPSFKKQSVPNQTNVTIARGRPPKNRTSVSGPPRRRGRPPKNAQHNTQHKILKPAISSPECLSSSRESSPMRNDIRPDEYDDESRVCFSMYHA